MRLALFIESHDLAVKNGPVGRKCRNGFYQGWKPMRQALPIAGPHRNLRIFLHGQSPHSVELQFEQPLIVIERFLNQRCEHGLDDFGNGRTASFLHAELFKFALDRSDPMSSAVLLADFVDELSGDDRFRPYQGDVVFSRSVAVADLEENPLARFAAAPHQHPFAFEFFAPENEMQLPFLPAFLRCFGIDHLVRAVIPNNDFAGAVVPFRDDAFKFAVVDRMILRLHSQTFLGGIERRTFGDRPRSKDASHFKPEVVVEASRVMLLDNEAVPASFFYGAGRFWGFVEFPFPFVFFKAHPKPIIAGMGRLRIKKKEAVIPFRETLAYRMMLLAGSVVVFLIALYIMVGALQANITVSFISSGVVAAAAAFAVFYNLDHLRDARIPKQTMNRMKR